jgi:hypothetical protein
MIGSEILNEKHRIQAELSRDSASIHEYLIRSHAAAIEIAASFGFPLQYADLPRREGMRTRTSLKQGGV